MHLHHTVVRDIAVLGLAAAGAFLGACASSQTVDNFDAVSEGMSMDQVHEQLGEPSSTWQLNSAEHGMDGVRYQWGDNLSSVASSAVYRDAAPERVYSVTFDKDGQVVSKSYPLWAEPK